MMTLLPAGFLAQSDFGELIPFLIFVVIIVTRLVKAFADRGGLQGREPPAGGALPDPDEGADPGAQLRRFLEEIRRQAAGEPPPQPPTPPPRMPRPAAPARTAPPPLPDLPHATEFAPAGRVRPLAALPHATEFAPAGRTRRLPDLPNATEFASPRRTALRSGARPPSAVAPPLPPVSAKVATLQPVRPKPVLAAASVFRRQARPLALFQRGREGLREAIVLREVFGPPLGLRGPTLHEPHAARRV